MRLAINTVELNIGLSPFSVKQPNPENMNKWIACIYWELIIQPHQSMPQPKPCANDRDVRPHMESLHHSKLNYIIKHHIHFVPCVCCALFLIEPHDFFIYMLQTGFTVIWWPLVPVKKNLKKMGIIREYGYNRPILNHNKTQESKLWA